jgi:hypothetical protein
MVRTKAVLNRGFAMPLKFHPLADIFPLMEGAEFDELVADIKAHGLREKINCYENQIVDGRNRYRALQRIEDNPECNPYYFRVLTLTTDKGVRNYIISKNIHRRHLKAEDRQKFLVELVRASPEKSDRQLAKEAGTTHPTIAKVRKQVEATGKDLPVEKRIGADGRARKQPARKAATEKARKPTKRQLKFAEYRRKDEEANRALAILAERLGDDGLAILAAAMHHVGASPLQDAVERKFDVESDHHKRIYWYSDDFSDYLAKRDTPIRDLEIEFKEDFPGGFTTTLRRAPRRTRRRRMSAPTT